MWNFKDLKINGKVVLAPMAGFTSSGYRKFMIPFGVSLAYTEMVSDMGLIYENKETIDYVKFEKSEVPVGVQLFGYDPKNLQKAVKIALDLNKNIAFFDINMACPVPKVTKTGAGSSILKNPKLAGDIIRSIKEVTDLPVSAKIRLGWDEKHINFLDVITELENAGVDMIAIHARTAKDLYTGKPRFELVKGLRQKMSVPLLISGNIYTLEDAKNALEITGADAVMIARGGVGNPILISEINNYYEEKEDSLTPSFDEQVNYCKELARDLIEEKGEDIAMRVFRSMAPKFFVGFPNAKQLKIRLASELKTYQNLEDILNEYRLSNI